MSITQRTITIETASGNGFRCYAAVPVDASGPGLLLLHD